MNRVTIAPRRKRSTALEWLIIAPIVALAVWLMIYKAPPMPPIVDHVIILPTASYGPNVCPAGFRRGDFVEGGRAYTCEEVGR